MTDDVKKLNEILALDLDTDLYDLHERGDILLSVLLQIQCVRLLRNIK